MQAHRLAFVLLLLPLALGCAATASDEPDGQDTASADTIAQASAKVGAFVVPNLSADEADKIVQDYARLDPEHVIAANLLRDAIVYYDVNKAHLDNPGHMAIVDFALGSGKDRFFLVDVQTGQVTPHRVAHGSGSDPNGTGIATKFSNVDGSHMSSLGFALAAETYSGVHGRSLRLDGLSATDSNLRSRAIVVHGAAYVHDTSNSQGRSFGCFALDTDVKDEVIDALHGGALLYAGIGD